MYNTYQIQQKTRQNREKHKRYGQTEQGVIVAELCSQSLYIRTWLLLTRAGGNLGAKYRCTEKRFRYKLPKFPKIGENKRLFRRFAGLPPSTPNQTANPDFEWTTLHQQTTLQRGKAGCFVKLCSLGSHVTTFSVPSVTDTSLKFQFFIATLNESGHSSQKTRHSRKPTWSQQTLSWKTHLPY